MSNWEKEERRRAVAWALVVVIIGMCLIMFFAYWFTHPSILNVGAEMDRMQKTSQFWVGEKSGPPTLTGKQMEATLQAIQATLRSIQTDIAPMR